MGGRRFAFVAAAMSLLTVAGCTQDIQGLRTPRSAASQGLGIRWHEGSSTRYRWQVDQDFTINGQHNRHTVSGDLVVWVLSVDSSHNATLQVTVTLDSRYVQVNQPASQTYELTAGPRGKVAANPDGNFVDLTDLHTVLPLLPPPGSAAGDRWHEKYELPNPLMDDRRDYSVSGQYVRDEGLGLKRLAVIQVHMFAPVDDTAAYERLYGPPAKGDPQHMTIHDQGNETVDVTYWYDPVHQTVARSLATHAYNTGRTYIDDSNKQVYARAEVTGTETVTITRS